MSEIEVTYNNKRWNCNTDGVVLEASSAVFDRDVVRCTLKVTRNGELVHRDKVSLTSGTSRIRYLKRLSRSGVDVSESALIALDEAIRRTPTHDKPSVCVRGIGANTADKVISFDELVEVVQKWLLLDSPDVLRILFGAVTAHRLGGESPWLMIIAPPSGTKTELLRMLWSVPWVFPLSELTDKTFASGWDADGDDPSLLARLTDEVLVFKDFTTVLEMRRESRQAILAQLREIYDGRYDKAWGTGKEIHWTGRLGFIAGVTEAIDQYHSVLAILGPRFLMYRPELPDRQEVAVRSLENARYETEMRQELSEAAQQLLAGASLETPETDHETKVWVARVADIVTKARSAVIRDRYRREIEFVPQPELPARFARQIHALLQGIIVVSGRQSVTNEDLRCVASVAWDCVPGTRRKVLDVLFRSEDAVKTSTVAGQLQAPTVTVRRALEDLQVLGLIHCEKQGEGRADLWSLLDETRTSMAAMKLSELPTQDGSNKPNGAIQDLEQRLTEAYEQWQASGTEDLEREYNALNERYKALYETEGSQP